MVVSEKEEKPKIKKKLNRRFFLKSLLWTLVILVALILLLAVGIYVFGFEGKIITKIAGLIPFPVASVDGHLVFFNDFAEVKSALKEADSFFLSRGIISQEVYEKNLQNLNKNILRGMVRNKKVEILLAERGARVINKEVDTETNKVLSQVENTDLIKEKIKELYNWDIEIYKEYVIRPEMERLKLERVVSAELGEKSFDDWFIEKMAGAEVKVFLKGYKWDKESLSVVEK